MSDEATRPAAGVVTSTEKRNGALHVLPTAGNDGVVSVASRRSPAANGAVGVNTSVPPCTASVPGRGVPAIDTARFEPLSTDSGVGEGSATWSALPGAMRRGTAVTDAYGKSNACSAADEATSSSPSNSVTSVEEPCVSAHVRAVRPCVLSSNHTRPFDPASSHGPSSVNVCGANDGATHVATMTGDEGWLTSASATVPPQAMASRVCSSASADAPAGNPTTSPTSGRMAVVASRISRRDCPPPSIKTKSLPPSNASARAAPLPIVVEATGSY